MTDQALPRAVRGPVDFCALRRLAASRAGVRVGRDGLRGYVQPTYSSEGSFVAKLNQLLMLPHIDADIA